MTPTIAWLHGLTCGTLVGLFTTLLLINLLRMSKLTDAQLEVLFRTWWQQSYPTPPGTHALLTHVGWGQFLLEQVERGANLDTKKRAFALLSLMEDDGHYSVEILTAIRRALESA